MLSPREASPLGLGVPARRPLNPAMRPWSGAVGQDRAEEEERKKKSSLSSFAVFGGQQLCRATWGHGALRVASSPVGRGPRAVVTRVKSQQKCRYFHPGWVVSEEVYQHTWCF